MDCDKKIFSLWTSLHSLVERYGFHAPVWFPCTCMIFFVTCIFVILKVSMTFDVPKIKHCSMGLFWWPWLQGVINKNILVCILHFILQNYMQGHFGVEPMEKAKPGIRGKFVWKKFILHVCTKAKKVDWLSSKIKHYPMGLFGALVLIPSTTVKQAGSLLSERELKPSWFSFRPPLLIINHKRRFI